MHSTVTDEPKTRVLWLAYYLRPGVRNAAGQTLNFAINCSAVAWERLSFRSSQMRKRLMRCRFAFRPLPSGKLGSTCGFGHWSTRFQNGEKKRDDKRRGNQELNDRSYPSPIRNKRKQTASTNNNNKRQLTCDRSCCTQLSNSAASCVVLVTLKWLEIFCISWISSWGNWVLSVSGCVETYWEILARTAPMKNTIERRNYSYIDVWVNVSGLFVWWI